MKSISVTRILFVLFLFKTSSLYSQEFYLTDYFFVPIGHISWITFNYDYVEFMNNNQPDSNRILESFHGTLIVSPIKVEFDYDETRYFLQLTKDGSKVLRTFYDTLSIENITKEEYDTVTVENEFWELGSEGYIHGWIFPDTLYESVSDSLDPIPMYPYSRLYSRYIIDQDSSLYNRDDTLFIHYRPKLLNYFDSFYSLDYVLSPNDNVRSFSRAYSYYGEGFNETYKFKNANWASIEDPDKKFITDNMFLYQNFPNPFNPVTRIKFSLKERRKIKLIVYDILGNKITTLIDEIKNKGEYEIEFDGSKLSNGVYFYSLISDNFINTKKCVILK